jgi:3-hydroxymyristoyl/3-hydroxydecanoyl-(acyl carrier protein) dehydratase
MIEKDDSPRDDEAQPGCVVRLVDVPVDHPAFAGHFPSHPMLPGAVILCEVLETALADQRTHVHLGHAPVIEQAKFLAPVGPGSRLTITLQGAPRAGRTSFDFSVDDEHGVAVARGRLTRQRPKDET